MGGGAAPHERENPPPPTVLTRDRSKRRRRKMPQVPPLLHSVWMMDDLSVVVRSITLFLKAESVGRLDEPLAARDDAAYIYHHSRTTGFSTLMNRLVSNKNSWYCRSAKKAVRFCCRRFMPSVFLVCLIPSIA